MKICERKEKTKPFWVEGNLYEKVRGTDDLNCIFLATDREELVDISTGLIWVRNIHFSASPEWWKDVTDKYCLKRIEDE